MENCLRPITVVIPTIGKCPDITNKLINYLSDFVNEILLFDNEKKFSNKNFPDNVKVMRRGNLFVNGSWNEGAKIARNDYLLFVNDDVWFDVQNGQLLDDIIFELENKVFCVLGSSNDDMVKIDCVEDIKEETNNDLYITKTDTMPYNWGAIIAIKKKYFLPINPELKIWYGDNSLFYFTDLMASWGKNKGIMHFKWFHKQSASQTEELVDEFQKREESIWVETVSLMKKKAEKVFPKE